VVTIIGLLVATISMVREIGRMMGRRSEDYDISRSEPEIYSSVTYQVLIATRRLAQWL